MLFPGTDRSSLKLMETSAISDASQERIADLFIEVLCEKRSHDATPTSNNQELVAKLLRRRLDQASPQLFEELSETASTQGGESCSVLLAEMDAKLCDIQMRTRRAVQTRVSQLAQDGGGHLVGDSFDEFCSRASRSPSCTSDKMQKLVESGCALNISLTTHPTNPCSLAYTQAGILFERAVASGADGDALKSSLRLLRDTSMDVLHRPSRKKSTEEETEEIVTILNIIDDSVQTPIQRLRRSLDRYGFVEVEIGKPLLRPCAWAAGDGDGNPLQNWKTLLYQVMRFRLGACTALETELAALLNHPGLKTVGGSGVASDLKDLERIRARVEDEIKKLTSTTVSTSQHLGLTPLPAVNLEAQLMIPTEETAIKNDLLAKLATLRNEALTVSRSMMGDYKAADSLAELCFHVRHRIFTFGLHFARTDVRHNSLDFMTTVGVLFAIFGFQPLVDLYHQQQKYRVRTRFSPSPKDLFATFSAIADDLLLSKLIRQAMDDGSFLRHVSDVLYPSDATSQNLGGLQDALFSLAGLSNTSDQSGGNASADEFTEACEVCARITGRLRIMGLFPAAFAKVIIAETRSPSHFLGALFMLKLGGSTVGHGATIAVVPLFESSPDLQAAPSIMNGLLHDPLVLSHVQGVGELLVMIARSDTSRLSGSGAQGAQEDCYAEILSIDSKSYSKDGGSSGGFEVSVFLGGGADSMRGGGRIQESMNVVLTAASRFDARGIVSSIHTTIQGIQTQIFLAPGGYTIEGFCAQNLLSNAKLLGALPYRDAPKDSNVRIAIKQTNDFYALARRNYEFVIGDPQSISGGNAGSPPTAGQQRRASVVAALVRDFPDKFITGQGNKSSRPGSRKKNDDPLQSRAIGLDLISKHSGVQIGTFGVAQALVEMNRFPKSSPYSPLRHAFLVNKSFRDYVRIQSLILAQKNYPETWSLRGGGGPSSEEKTQLKENFLAKCGENASPREFIAWLEDQDQLEATLLLEAISGKPGQNSVSPILTDAAIPRCTNLAAPIEAGWPGMLAGLELRRRQCAFSRHSEIKMAKIISAKLANKQPISQVEKDIAYFAFVGANISLSTPSFNLSVTSPGAQEKLRLNMTAYMKRHPRLAVPSWIAAGERKQSDNSPPLRQSKL